MTIADVKKAPENTPIVGLTVQFLKAYEKKFGESARGSWTLQNFDVQDDSGETITVMASNREEDFAQLGWEGKKILLSSVMVRGQLAGLIAFDDKYGNTVTRKLKLTPSGECRLLEAEAAPTPPKQQKLLSLDTAGELMEFCHRISQNIYPKNDMAAAAVGNALFQAVLQGDIDITTFITKESGDATQRSEH